MSAHSRIGLWLILSFVVDPAAAGQADHRALLSLKPAGLEVRHVEFCRIGLKPASGSADFIGRWMYDATVASDGSVSRVTRLDDPVDAARFVELADFEKCLTRWQFTSPGAYRLLLWGGTMSDHWSVTVVHGIRSMRVRIPRSLQSGSLTRGCTRAAPPRSLQVQYRLCRRDPE